LVVGNHYIGFLAILFYFSEYSIFFLGAFISIGRLVDEERRHENKLFAPDSNLYMFFVITHAIHKKQFETQEKRIN
jgi:hypothetical protein